MFQQPFPTPKYRPPCLLCSLGENDVPEFPRRLAKASANRRWRITSPDLPRPKPQGGVIFPALGLTFASSRRAKPSGRFQDRSADRGAEALRTLRYYPGAFCGWASARPSRPRPNGRWQVTWRRRSRLGDLPGCSRFPRAGVPTIVHRFRALIINVPSISSASALNLASSKIRSQSAPE